MTCSLTEVCFSRAGDGVYDCVDVSALNLVDGDTYHLSLPGAGIYQVWTATPSGTSSIEEVQVNCYDETFDCENPYAVNYDATASNPDELACIYDTCVCDCAGTSHSMGVLTFLGDGELEDESEGKTWNNNPVHLRCNVWGFDCGDAGINFDPYGVCEGNFPPSRGCQEYSLGCTDDTACNFEPTAVTDDGTCDYSCQGCTDSGACNYNASATTDDSSCDYSCLGCTYMEACNFNPLATEEDGSCEFSSCAGCTYPEASNYNAEASYDNGSCLFNMFDPCLGNMNSDGVIGVQDLIMLLQVYGFICE
ncbi:MAG: hypothetical protein P8L71_06790 [Flavobacteriales bacterium]|nr:hypothetical protein [Flavobacteriales bacterium]